MGCSPPGSSVCGISQARILEWVAISYSRWSSQPRDWTHISYTGRQILYHWATREAHVCVVYASVCVCVCVRARARMCVYLAMLCALWDLGFPTRATAVRAQGPNHWAAGEFPKYVYFEFLEHKCGQNSNCTNKPMTKTPKFLVKGGVLNMHMWLCKLLNLH